MIKKMWENKCGSHSKSVQRKSGETNKQTNKNPKNRKMILKMENEDI